MIHWLGTVVSQGFDVRNTSTAHKQKTKEHWGSLKHQTFKFTVFSRQHYAKQLTYSKYFVVSMKIGQG